MRPGGTPCAALLRNVISNEKVDWDHVIPVGLLYMRNVTYTRNVTVKCNITHMAASQITCSDCGETFYGRAGASYCSSKCRQRAYRSRSTNRHVANICDVTANCNVADPVPIGDGWMVGRFATEQTLWEGYQSPAPAISLAEAEAMPVDGEGWSNTKKAKAQKERNKAVQQATINLRVTHDKIDYYIAELKSLRHSIWSDDDADVVYDDEPVGDALPETIGPEVAAKMAEDLEATLPRIVELLGLFRRRAGEDQDSEKWLTRPS